MTVGRMCEKGENNLACGTGGSVESFLALADG